MPLKMTRKEFDVHVLKKPGAKLKKKKRKMVMTDEDRAWSAAVKQRAGLVCEYGLRYNRPCGHFGGGQVAHHIFSRSNKSVRHYTPNGCSLCNGHHKFIAHKFPEKFRQFLIALRGEAWWEDLNRKANIRHQVFK
jgi:hypothetical protein